MKYGSSPVVVFVRLLILAAGLTTAAAHADDYSEVSQLLHAGKLIEAQARVERFLAAKPRDPQMRFYRGVIQRESGRQAEAIVTFTKLTEDYPSLPEPYNNLAVIHAAQGQYDKARIDLEKALHTNPSYATAHDNLGDIYAQLASQAYSKALQLDGASPPPQAKLALIRDLSTPPGSQPRPMLASAPAAKPPAAPAAPVATPAPVKPAAVAAAPVSRTTSATVPAAPKPPAPASPTASPDGGREVEQAVRAWARAWADKNMAQYLAAYGKDFETPGHVPRGAWEQDRRLRITGKSHISVNLLELHITVKGNRAVAKFRQDYKADALAVLSRKTLELTKSGDRWLIVKEFSGS
jgi:Flp pilus assembly protein TadD/ketosteroid isomerase-like protein